MRSKKGDWGYKKSSICNYEKILICKSIKKKKQKTKKKKKSDQENTPQRETLVWRSWIRLNFSKLLKAITICIQIKHFTRFFKKLKINKKKKNSGIPIWDRVIFDRPSVVRRLSWSSKFFLHFCRPNTRALCTHVALLLAPLNGIGLRPRYARKYYTDDFKNRKIVFYWTFGFN